MKYVHENICQYSWSEREKEWKSKNESEGECVCERESDDAWAATSGGVKVEEGGGRETNK